MTQPKADDGSRLLAEAHAQIATTVLLNCWLAADILAFTTHHWIAGIICLLPMIVLAKP